MAGTYKEILARFKKDLGNTYQAQKNIVDVSQKYIGLLENAEGGSGAGGIDYSTEEQDTGLKWIDGRKIYQKTATLSNISISANSATDVNISDYFSNISLIIEAECISDNAIIPTIMINSALSPYSIGLSFDISSNHITFTRGSGGAATLTAYLTLRYTKVS